MKKICLSGSIVLSFCLLLAVYTGAIALPQTIVHPEVQSCVAGSFSARSSEKNVGDLSGDSFRLLVWNIYKEQKPGWEKELATFAGDADLVALQEGALTSELAGSLTERDMAWQQAQAFSYEGADSGVVTASQASPQESCLLREEESIIGLPKTALLSRYSLNGEQDLLFVNLHLVNFSLGVEGYSRQLEKIYQVLVHHSGPIVVAGDFNTWSERRQEVVDAFAADLDLAPVIFSDDKRISVFGRNLDHVYSRGLTVLASKVLPAKSSDHNPMLVDFSLK
ncbi:endonuclease/exonuclease/phosphatase family protein [Desulfotalea psychrophila]|uniref:Endonuclease/exonuclease/phosphatase domain-containing protein n=1 Tax=Desulfotalea psychrophila (strain LSv54 / DSM 12343) TaxID=177439 RepID=Q6AKC9_DESPS|nr:endonuclease/exonuclease/phosphatase family protein [Desulfotalea psychrophila]CAG37196.1 conserved hypothetical protein [Desulfotalea psychrophila LSv54]